MPKAREDHYDLSTIQTVSDVLRRAGDIAMDTDKYKSIPYPMVLTLLTEAAYPGAYVGNGGPGGVSYDPQYQDHLRIRSMDLAVQAAAKANGIPNLFRTARHNRLEAGQLLHAAAAAAVATA